MNTAGNFALALLPLSFILYSFIAKSIRHGPSAATTSEEDTFEDADVAHSAKRFSNHQGLDHGRLHPSHPSNIGDIAADVADSAGSSNRQSVIMEQRSSIINSSSAPSLSLVQAARLKSPVSEELVNAMFEFYKDPTTKHISGVDDMSQDVLGPLEPDVQEVVNGAMVEWVADHEHVLDLSETKHLKDLFTFLEEKSPGIFEIAKAWYMQQKALSVIFEIWAFGTFINVFPIEDWRKEPSSKGNLQMRRTDLQGYMVRLLHGGACRCDLASGSKSQIDACLPKAEFEDTAKYPEGKVTPWHFRKIILPAHKELIPKLMSTFLETFLGASRKTQVGELAPWLETPMNDISQFEEVTRHVKALGFQDFFQDATKFAGAVDDSAPECPSAMPTFSSYESMFELYKDPTTGAISDVWFGPDVLGPLEHDVRVQRVVNAASLQWFKLKISDNEWVADHENVLELSKPQDLQDVFEFVEKKSPGIIEIAKTRYEQQKTLNEIFEIWAFGTFININGDWRVEPNRMGNPPHLQMMGTELQGYIVRLLRDEPCRCDLADTSKPFSYIDVCLPSAMLHDPGKFPEGKVTPWQFRRTVLRDYKKFIPDIIEKFKEKFSSATQKTVAQLGFALKLAMQELPDLEAVKQRVEALGLKEFFEDRAKFAGAVISPECPWSE